MPTMRQCWRALRATLTSRQQSPAERTGLGLDTQLRDRISTCVSHSVRHQQTPEPAASLTWGQKRSYGEDATRDAIVGKKRGKKWPCAVLMSTHEVAFRWHP